MEPRTLAVEPRCGCWNLVLRIRWNCFFSWLWNSQDKAAEPGVGKIRNSQEENHPHAVEGNPKGHHCRRGIAEEGQLTIKLENERTRENFINSLILSERGFNS
jgi:hypothetical protein